MRRMLLTLLTLLAIVGLPASGYCATELTAKQVEVIKSTESSLRTIEQLAANQIINSDQKAKGESFYLDQASTAVGHKVTMQEFEGLIASADQSAGYTTLWSIALVIGGLAITAGLIGLFIKAFGPILDEIPPAGYELLAYATAGVLSFGTSLFSVMHVGPAVLDPLWFAIPGALCFAGCFFLSYNLHFKTSSKSLHDTVMAGPGFISFPVVMFSLCTLVWGALAVHLHHLFPEAAIPYVIAFGSVMALQAALGFSVITMPGCIAMGWTKDAQVPRSIFSSLIILAAYVYLKLSGKMVGDIALFETGAAFMGAFVYYLGLLVVSSKWYVWAGASKNDGASRYLTAQVITIASGIAAFYFGSVFHLGVLLGIGGTFFGIYALEKFYEVKWGVTGYLVSLILLGLAIFFLRGFAIEHSEYFIWGYPVVLRESD